MMVCSDIDWMSDVRRFDQHTSLLTGILSLNRCDTASTWCDGIMKPLLVTGNVYIVAGWNMLDFCVVRNVTIVYWVLNLFGICWQLIDEFTDVNEGEKELMKLWNVHVMHHK